VKGEEKPAASNQSVGALGEELAAAFLRQAGYRIVERNFRCKGGEADIVARDGKTLVFVEVKTRRSMSYGPPQLAVTPFKQRQISKAALTWLAKNRQQDAPARFDVIAVMLFSDGTHRIEHIPNAFDLAY
jgi:putative endonuclease